MLAAVIERGADAVAEAEGVAFGDVTVLIVDVARMRELHREFFDDPSPTDVITFPAECGRDGKRIDGDIAVCVDVAREQAADAGHGTCEEIIFLALHGLLHLCGWDDCHDIDRARMIARQYKLMEDVGIDLGPMR